jgi:hypothetical protein
MAENVHFPSTGDYVVIRWPLTEEKATWSVSLVAFWTALVARPPEVTLHEMLLELKRKNLAFRGDYPHEYLAMLALKGVIIQVR